MIKKQIIFIEKEPSFNKKLKGIIRSCGFNPLAIENEKELSKILSKNPDLILLNIDFLEIPWKKLLLENKEEIKKLTLPVLGYTSVSDHDWPKKKEEAKKAGCDAIISKISLLNNPSWQLALYTRPLDFTMAKKKLPKGIRKGIELFNQAKFHEAHDEIEPVWLKEKRDFRMLYQGILQIGIAFYQIEHEKYDVALRMFTCGKLKIRHFLPKFQGVDVKSLFLDSERAEKALKKLGAEKISSFDQKFYPKIEVNS